MNLKSLPRAKSRGQTSNLKTLILAVFVITAVFLFVIPRVAHASYDTIPQVKVYNPDATQVKSTFLAYQESFRGGLKIASGDIDGDSRDEIITGAGPDGGPHVQVFDMNGNFMWQTMAFDERFKGGIDVAAGDVNGDGKDEIIVSQLSGGQAWIKIYKANGRKTILADFLAFASSFQGGCHIAAGDVDGDGKDEIIAGAGSSGRPHIRVFDGKGNWTGWDTFAFHEDFRGGVDLVSEDIDNDGRDEIIVAQNSFGQAWVKVYRANRKKTIVSEFLAYAPNFKGGTNIGAGDLDQDGKAEIITGANAGGGPHVRVFKASGQPKSISFFPYPLDFQGGVNVAIGNLQRDATNEIITSPGRKLPEGRVDLYKYIEIDLSSQTLTYFENGHKIDKFYISSGIARYPTPKGEFKIIYKIEKTRMKHEYGPNHPDNYDLKDVPHCLGFYQDQMIHGAYWHHNFGHKMSHGCVNEPLDKAAQLYNWASIGIPVIIHD